MATGISNSSDFKIYDEQLQAGYIEMMTQFTNAFNAASKGSIAMTAASKLGNYVKEAFFKDISSLIMSRQDITSNSAATALKLEQGENIRVKLHRKIGPVATTFKAFSMIGENASEEASFLLGQSIAKAQPAEMLNSGLIAAKAAIGNNSAMLNDVTEDSGKITHTNLIGTLRKMGDAYSSLSAWVMHSSAFFDLGLDGVAQSVDTVVAGILQVFSVPSLGIPIIVTDSPALIDNSEDELFVLGLTSGAIQLVDSEATRVIAQPNLGNEQLELMIQGESAYNLGVKGYSYKVASGANPNATALALGTNWDKVASDNKNTAGVMLRATQV